MLISTYDGIGRRTADKIIVRVQIPLGALNAYARFLCGEVPQTLVNAQISGVEWVYNHLNV